MTSSASSEKIGAFDMATSELDIASRNRGETPANHIQRPSAAPALQQVSLWNGGRAGTLEPPYSEDLSLPLPRPAAHATVLVVDDDIAIATLLQELLESAGYRVLLAGTGRTALSLARTERPALVLTDYMMPGIDGAEFVRRLRGSPVTSNIPVVMMSSVRPSLAPRDNLAVLRLQEARVIRKVQHGVYLAVVGDVRLPFLEKPFDVDVVLELVAAATASKMTERDG